MPTLDRVLEIRNDHLCDDLEISQDMCNWSEEQLSTYFESGGKVQPVDSRQPPFRFLSLHGGGANATVNRMQLARLIKAFRDEAGLHGPNDIEFDHVEGTREWKHKDPMLVKMLGEKAQFFGWYGVENSADADSADGRAYVSALLDESVKFEYIDADKALDQIDAHIQQHGPYDALVGFSQGATVATMLTARTLQRAAAGVGPPPSWRCNLMLSALAPRAEGVPGCFIPEPASPPIPDFPCIMCIGVQDPFLEVAQKNRLIYGNLQWFEHSGGHEAPTRSKEDAHVAAKVARAVWKACGVPVL